MTDPHRLPGEISVPDIGVGTWAWGDRGVWGMGGYDSTLTEATIAEAWEASIDAGATFFDTAEVYGNGESERIIGRLLAADPGRAAKAVIATKFMPVPWKFDVVGSLRRALEASLGRLGVGSVALYQIHGPISLRGHAHLADALAAVHEDGLVGAVGVSNYSAKEMRSIARELAERGIQLATNQIEFSLLRRRPESNGLLAACRELGVLPLAYSPLGQGRLTGKYDAEHPPPKGRSFSNHPMVEVDAIVNTLRELGGAHDRTPSQVALQWIVSKGVVPIPGAKNRLQAEQNAGGMGWSLTEEELTRLDNVALEGTNDLRNRFWQHG
ncbi:MAG: aldo/keto reductase [Acidimicrobiales bacterium]|nr:aldo/keto reductase [Acidimicrobiales bacterium]MCB1247328.1 aldo/keto reductase [Acidimicrobiia bacterium]